MMLNNVQLRIHYVCEPIQSGSIKEQRKVVSVVLEFGTFVNSGHTSYQSPMAFKMCIAYR